jgi:hypothetical protein
MSLEELKRMLAECPCHPDVALKARDILNAAIERGNITSEERKAIIDLINLEIEAAEAEATALESTSKSLLTFADQADRYLATAEAELAALDSSLSAA